jgi:hypothetical protein
VCRTSGGHRKELEGGTPQKKIAHPPKCEKPLHNELMNNIQDKFIVNIKV